MTNKLCITSPKAPMILIMAGGTGGHIFPGIAVADELKAQGWKVHWLGTAERMESTLVPSYGYEISYIKISGLRGKSLLSLLVAPFKLLNAYRQAKKLISSLNPDVVLGMGGYASAPGGLATSALKIPLIIHEQNAAAGLSNRLLARFASKICCAFPNAFNNKYNVNIVGNPIRSSITSKNIRNDKRSTATGMHKNILVVGGSLGAQVLNEIIPQYYASLVVDNEFNVWHQTGKNKQSKVVKYYSHASIAAGKIKITEFIDDMAAAYQWADLVICRAGALTVSEIAMAATPAIFVPLPHAVDDHQTKNALYLVNRNAAKIMPQSQLNVKNLTTMITELFADPETLNSMANNAYKAATFDATRQVANLCKQLVSIKTNNLECHKENV
jgi:UDP-N-acetylglucosamine--N-acetylmuramyl-(pentapeptide) pyrophosphoryl-undecaprenol N-acetylglucosamine transferase